MPGKDKPRQARTQEDARSPEQPWRTEGLPKGQPAKRRPGWIVTLLWLLGYVVFFLLVTLQDRTSGPQTIPYTEFKAQVANNNVSEIFARGNTIEGALKKAAPLPGQPRSTNQQGRTYQKFTTERPTFAVDNLLAELSANHATVRATPLVQHRGVLANLLISIAPFLLLIFFYVWMFKRQKAAMGAGLFGGGKRKPVDPETVRVTFEDVAGIDEVEAEINEVVDFLRHPGKYRRLGARAPKGVLLAGPPGTGKTLLARATAGEAHVPFFSASASEFIEMIVGVGASRVRELFAEARKVAPAIVFIDEIDTIGRTRGGRVFGGHDEREQTLNQILTEMDGFSGHEGVVVLAATNRPDVLDPALHGEGNPVVAIGDEVGPAHLVGLDRRQVTAGEAGPQTGHPFGRTLQARREAAVEVKAAVDRPDDAVHLDGSDAGVRLPHHAQAALHFIERQQVRAHLVSTSCHR